MSRSVLDCCLRKKGRSGREDGIPYIEWGRSVRVQPGRRSDREGDYLKGTARQKIRVLSLNLMHEPGWAQNE